MHTGVTGESPPLWGCVGYAPVPRGMMPMAGSGQASLCRMASRTPRTQPTVPSPPHTKIRKRGTSLNVCNLEHPTYTHMLSIITQHELKCIQTSHLKKETHVQANQKSSVVTLRNIFTQPVVLHWSARRPGEGLESSGNCREFPVPSVLHSSGLHKPAAGSHPWGACLSGERSKPD